MVASVHSWQLVHSATSMIMFHLDITLSPADAAFTLTFVAVIVRESGRSSNHRR
jgi:hypothetical protein